jgi:hypothetical protein
MWLNMSNIKKRGDQMPKCKKIYIHFFDDPMDDAIQEWLDDMSEHYSQEDLEEIVKAVLFKYAQQQGFGLPESEPTQTGNNMISTQIKLWPNIFQGVKFSGNLKR